MVDRPHHYINHNVSEKFPRVMKSSTNLAGNITLVLYSHQGPNVDYIIGQSGGWYVSPIWWKMGQGLYSAAPVRGLRLERGTRRPIVTTASTMTNDNNSSNSNSNHQNNSPILRSTLLEQSSRQANTKKNKSRLPHLPELSHVLGKMSHVLSVGRIFDANIPHRLVRHTKQRSQESKIYFENLCTHHHKLKQMGNDRGRRRLNAGLAGNVVDVASERGYWLSSVLAIQPAKGEIHAYLV